MIPVDLQDEPANFDERVRQPGLAWLAEHGMSLDQAPSDPSKLPNYWTRTNEQLWEAYSGVCAYLSIYFEWVTGAASTDHFIAKSSLAGEAYEWNNFRLSCLAPNRSKNKYDDVIDPVGMAKHTFVINFSSGEISPNPALSAEQKALARKTITRLKLDSHQNDKMRAEHFTSYIQGDFSLDYLSRKSPFVYTEIMRQGLNHAVD